MKNLIIVIAALCYLSYNVNIDRLQAAVSRSVEDCSIFDILMIRYNYYQRLFGC